MKSPYLMASAFLGLPFALLGGCGGRQAVSESGASATSLETSVEQSPPAAPSAPRAANRGVCPTDPLIDDFEDGDNRGNVADGRGGYWYTYADPSSQVEPTGNFTPREGGADDSSYSGGMKGSIGSQQYPYVGLGISFTEPKAPYDLSCCEGVSFKGKKNGEGIANVRLKVGDWQTSPEGGACQDCYNDFGGDFVFSNEWQEFSLEFADMRQEPYWGESKPSIDTTAVYQLQWQVKENDRPFDIQVDDVRLIGCGD